MFFSIVCLYVFPAELWRIVCCLMKLSWSRKKVGNYVSKSLLDLERRKILYLLIKVQSRDEVNRKSDGFYIRWTLLVCSLDWKDRVCQTVKKAFVCLSVCLFRLSQCDLFLKPQWNLLSVDQERRFLSRQMKKNLSFSLHSSLSSRRLVFVLIRASNLVDNSCSLSLSFSRCTVLKP